MDKRAGVDSVFEVILTDITRVLNAKCSEVEGGAAIRSERDSVSFTGEEKPKHEPDRQTAGRLS